MDVPSIRKIEVQSRKLILHLSSDLNLQENLNQPIISLRNLDDPTFLPRQITSRDLKKTILFLKPSTRYSLTVFGKDLSNGKNEIFREYRFQTLSDSNFQNLINKCLLGSSKPQNVEIQKISSHEAMLKWQPPAQTNGQIQGYVVMYTFDDHFWAIEKTPNLQFKIALKEAVKKITALVAAYTGPNEGDMQGGGMSQMSRITMNLNSTGNLFQFILY